MTPLIGIMMLAAYLLGSVSSAVLVSKLFRLPDPRLHGSGNPGATNVLRLGGKLPAILVLLFDILKGTIPVWGSYFLKIEPLFLGLIAICACVGHIFPLFFGFKGGKAVATAFGAMMPIGLEIKLMGFVNVEASLMTWKTALIDVPFGGALGATFCCGADDVVVVAHVAVCTWRVGRIKDIGMGGSKGIQCRLNLMLEVGG